MNARNMKGRDHKRKSLMKCFLLSLAMQASGAVTTQGPLHLHIQDIALSTAAVGAAAFPPGKSIASHRPASLLEMAISGSALHAHVTSQF